MFQWQSPQESAFAAFVVVCVMADDTEPTQGACACGEFTPAPWHPRVFRQVVAVPPAKLAP